MARPARLAATQNCQRSVEKAATAIIAIQNAERARERELVADAVLHVAEGESADGGRDVHEEDHEERVLGLEPHDGGGVDGRERDDDGDAALIEEPADGKPGKVAEVAERAERAAQLRKALRGGAPDGLAVRASRRGTLLSLRKRKIGSAEAAKTKAVTAIVPATVWSIP